MKLFKNLLCLAIILYSQICQATLQVDVSGGNFDPIPIYFGAFAGSQELGVNFMAVIEKDLVNSGLFKSLNSGEYKLLAKQPNFHKLRSMGADYVAGGKIAYNKNEEITLELYVWNAATGHLVIGHRLNGKMHGWRQLAHIAADMIYSNLTGEKPYFTSKILFIDETGPIDNRLKKVAIMDQDGANVAYLTNGEHLTVTPKIAPDRQNVVYTAYIDDSPHTCLQQLKTGARTIVEQSTNGTIAPNFSPDGNGLVMGKLRDNGTANLFLLNIQSMNNMLKSQGAQTKAVHGEANMRQLTYGNNIDATSSFSPDGKQLVFSSDSSGRQQLYIMKIDGSAKKQLSTGSGSYSTPVWSPRGDYIAFTKKEHGQFSIGICRTDGSEERLLSSGFHSERPCWAPNGRSLIFFKESAAGHSRLYSIDIMNQKERLLTTPHDASDPDWSFRPL